MSLWGVILQFLVYFFFLCVQKIGQVQPSQGSSEMLSLVTEVKEEKTRGKK